MWLAALGDGPHQRRLAHARFRGVDLRAAVEQQLDQLQIPRADGHQQRSVAAPARGVDIGLGIEQHARYRQVAVAAGEQQRRLAIFVGGVDVGSGGQQRGDDLGDRRGWRPRASGVEPSSRAAFTSAPDLISASTAF